MFLTKLVAFLNHSSLDVPQIRTEDIVPMELEGANGACGDW